MQERFESLLSGLHDANLVTTVVEVLPRLSHHSLEARGNEAQLQPHIVRIARRRVGQKLEQVGTRHVTKRILVCHTWPTLIRHPMAAQPHLHDEQPFDARVEGRCAIACDCRQQISRAVNCRGFHHWEREIVPCDAVTSDLEIHLKITSSTACFVNFCFHLRQNMVIEIGTRLRYGEPLHSILVASKIHQNGGKLLFGIDGPGYGLLGGAKHPRLVLCVVLRVETPLIASQMELRTRLIR
mmetsp:Transcript_131606/g.262622  ORF Transcript_131606/g.262622 Transcript_131606/m.262622 type:complete len:240 (-) Transcript_131606:508-1227(-)